MTNEELENIVINQSKVIDEMANALESQIRTQGAIVEAIDIIANYIGLPRKSINTKEVKH